MTILALSPEDQDYYHEQKNHYQTIANAYIDWYGHQKTLSQTSISTYYFVSHGILILNSLWVLSRLHLMGSLMKLDSPAVLV